MSEKLISKDKQKMSIVAVGDYSVVYGLGRNVSDVFRSAVYYGTSRIEFGVEAVERVDGILGIAGDQWNLFHDVQSSSLRV